MTVQTAVMVDLVGYSDTARMLEETLGAAAVAALNRDIQRLIDRALAGAGGSRAANLVMTTGDGAFLRFDAADPALAFAAALQDAARADNADRTDPAALRIFRIGVATGEIAIDLDADRGPALAGMAIVRAARLESRSPPGGALIDPASWNAAAPGLRAAYCGPEQVAGKRDETFAAYSSLWTGAGPGAAAPRRPAPATPRAALLDDILNLFARLRRREQYELLEIRLGIALDRRSPDTVTLERRRNHILHWAEEEDALDRLAETLRTIVGAGLD